MSEAQGHIADPTGEAQDVAGAVRAVLAAALEVNEAALQPQTELYDQLSADSISVMEALSVLEDRLGIRLPQSNAFAMQLRTVGDIVNAFETRRPHAQDQAAPRSRPGGPVTDRPGSGRDGDGGSQLP